MLWVFRSHYQVHELLLICLFIFSTPLLTQPMCIAVPFTVNSLEVISLSNKLKRLLNMVPFYALHTSRIDDIHLSNF